MRVTIRQLVDYFERYRAQNSDSNKIWTNALLEWKSEPSQSMDLAEGETLQYVSLNSRFHERSKFDYWTTTDFCFSLDELKTSVSLGLLKTWVDSGSDSYFSDAYNEPYIVNRTFKDPEELEEVCELALDFQNQAIPTLTLNGLRTKPNSIEIRHRVVSQPKPEVYYPDWESSEILKDPELYTDLIQEFVRNCAERDNEIADEIIDQSLSPLIDVIHLDDILIQC